MLSSYVGTEFDRRQLDSRVRPGYRLLLYSRWIDSDSAIILGTHRQIPVDITKNVISANLTLAASRDASSMACQILLDDKICPDLFYNCIVRLKEGVQEIDETEWPYTFTGFFVGQPQASEATTQDARPARTAIGERGADRTVNVTFVDRGMVYRTENITTPGVWIPRGVKRNPDVAFAYRDAIDDIGSIARDIATKDWGMGLDGAEVLLGKQPYRIEKQLQIVDTNVIDALTQILQPLHLVPVFNGAGQLTAYSTDVNKPVSRVYSRSLVKAMPQAQTNQAMTNSVTMRGLDSEITEVLHADQNLLSINGTFGFFDSEMVFRGSWGSDNTNSFRVKRGTLADSTGTVHESPRFRNFVSKGLIITTVNPPTFRMLTDFRYEIVITNDVYLSVGAIGALISGYAGLALLTTVLPELSTPAGDVPNPGAVAAQVASSALLLAGLIVLQQIGNFEFEVWGIPFESVYQELVAEANIGHFATFDTVGGSARRTYEKNAQDFENHIMSSEEDRTTDDGTVNKGIVKWAREQLAFEAAKSAERSVQTPVDLLLEPGDVIQHDGQVIFVDTITRSITRGTDDGQSVSGFQIRKAT